MAAEDGSMGEMRCPKCGRPAQEGWSLCPGCGTPLNPAVDGLRLGEEAGERSAWEELVEDYKPRSKSLRRVLRVLRIVARGLSLGGGIGVLIWLFSGEVLGDPLWMWLIVGGSCLLVGALLQVLEYYARKHVALDEGVDRPEDLLRDRYPESAQNTSKNGEDYYIYTGELKTE